MGWTVIPVSFVLGPSFLLRAFARLSVVYPALVVVGCLSFMFCRCWPMSLILAWPWMSWGNLWVVWLYLSTRMGLPDDHRARGMPLWCMASILFWVMALKRPCLLWSGRTATSTPLPRGMVSSAALHVVTETWAQPMMVPWCSATIMVLGFGGCRCFQA